MTRLTRLMIVLAAVVLIGGSSLAAVAVGQRNSSNAARQTLEARIAGLEAASKARLEGLGHELDAGFAGRQSLPDEWLVGPASSAGCGGNV
ncbi:MAG: hypothetical protein L0Z62_37035 [Gemmataceae bacterium]|nr:hypothetical protein [Gemmataceae bacterium]